ncbi:MAG: hypothetical protein K8I82_11705 [Anaerolineae bacterium]|nr:hypothetical protein [Anaerolineae bacterium]
MIPESDLRQMLFEDTESEALTEAVLPFIQQMKALPLPEPARSTASLIEQLAAELPRRPRWRFSEWHWWLILRSQVRIVSGEIWLASAVVMLCGTLVTLASEYPNSGGTWLALLAPIISAVGVAMLYDSQQESCMELEDASPVGIWLLLLARLTLVYGFNLLLGAAGSLSLIVPHPQLSLLPLMGSWLLPMTILCGLAFFLSIITRSALLSTLLCLFLWGAVNALDTALFSEASVQILGLLLTAGLIVAGLRLVNESERRLGAPL